MSRFAAEMRAELYRIFGIKENACLCYICQQERINNRTQLNLIPLWHACICGNKHCPKASNHQLECTGSNESGQPGSIY
jgi:hypothetical protein